VAEYVFAVNIRGVDRRAGVREDGRVPNRLASATSPYLLQHADNPVDWWEWGEDAFAEARRRDVPVLLSVGYSACHWCQVTVLLLRSARHARIPGIAVGLVDTGCVDQAAA
jgi:hypothetical protein